MAHSEGRQRHLRVLIVDSHEVSRAAIRALLQTEGLEVVADVAHRDPAVAAGRQASPDVALIDIGEGSGAALATARALERLPAMPTIVLTSSRRIAEGIDGYLFIPKRDICARQLLLAIEPRPPQP